MPDYYVIVIGAGNGHKILLLERHNFPGECAISFIRGRFEFEVALHQPNGVKLRMSDRAFVYIHPCIAYPIADIEILL